MATITENGPAIVEIAAVEIENLKNIEYGKIDFQPGRGAGANVVGIYGQNGSGKTAVLDAISILRDALTGQPLSAQAGEKVSAGVNRSHLVWTFNLHVPNEDTPWKVIYSFDLVRASDESNGYLYDLLPQSGTAYVPCHLENEIVRVSKREGERLATRRFIDMTRGNIFGPDKQFIALTGGGPKTRTKMHDLRENTIENGQSFVFSSKFQQFIAEHSRDKEAVDVLTWLRLFGVSSLHVMTVRDANLPAFDTQPIMYSEGSFKKGESGSLFVPLYGPVHVYPEMYERLMKRLKNINYVLGRIVPGQKINLLKRRSVWDADNRELYEVEIMSHRDDKTFPFRYESEGIRKLVTVLELISQVYARPGVTLAVDELDSGVFEYLLGELLEILASEGEGQLIFTAHNLYPMEKLHPGTVVQTTVDPRNRFTRRKGVRDNNNLRKQYIRDVFLGESEPAVYAPTDSSKIANAMQKIGALHE